MARKILFSAADLRSAQQNSECVTVDCRFNLSDPAAGLTSYLESHIPGAVYANLDDDLSSPITNISGRHPLPDAHDFALFLARVGWCPGKLLVAYDDAGGMIAARLWWLMKYFGHDCAVLLDGGLGAWRRAGFSLESGNVEFARGNPVVLRPNDDLVLSTSEIIEGLDRHEILLADARAYERFTGAVEPLDSVAGHISGAVNFPFSEHLSGDATLKPLDELRGRLQGLCHGMATHNLVHMCGSGVTACFNIFVSELAGLKGSKLYAGSWSEWIRDPSRAVER